MKANRTLCMLTFLLTGGSLWGQLQSPDVQASDRVEAVAIQVTRFGPNPVSITRPQGPFLLVIFNRSKVLEDTFSLMLKPSAAASAGSDSTGGNSLLDLHSTANGQRDQHLIRPLPGNYELRFRSHPEWVVDITITAN